MRKSLFLAKMKKWVAGVFIGSLIMLLVMRNGVTKHSFEKSILPHSITVNTSIDHLQSVEGGASHSVFKPKLDDQVVSADTQLSSLFVERNFSKQVRNSLLTWNYMKHLVNYSQGLPNGMEAIREAQAAWENLMESNNKRKSGDTNDSKVKEKQCPYFLNKMNTNEFSESGYKLRIPCGLTQGSAITIVGIPNGLLGSFRIDLAGEPLPGEPEPPIILHYNVRLLGDKLTKEPVIVQNTWSAANDWGKEERCPPSYPPTNTKVDELSRCNENVGKDKIQRFRERRSSRISIWSSIPRNASKVARYFPFKQGYLSVMTLRVGEEGIQMTVDGKHITSFAYRDSLEPWLIGEIRITGDLELISVLASGLPHYYKNRTMKSEHIVDLEALKSVQLQQHQPLDLFVGVFSTASNFERRMAVRRTWMQYSSVRKGAVAVRFFVGLHKNQLVNEELWTELQTYGDIQLMPFVDYYNLITWKTIAVCIFGAKLVSAPYVMKTDDDSFVRVDEVLNSLNRTNVRHGLLYGLIDHDKHPDRDTSSKWYVNFEEWAASTYPAWALGPGYVISNDIAKAVYRRHKKGHLKMFKLEDVAMGIWIEEMKNKGFQVNYVNEDRVMNGGCKNGYVVAHYQSPRNMLCLWKKLQEENFPLCC